MTAVASSTRRPTEPICPPWCAGHQGNYQGWENRLDGGRLRNHAEVGESVGNASVIVMAEENERHTLGAPIVELYVDGPDVADLTPAQARELAALLVDAAERAEAAR